MSGNLKLLGSLASNDSSAPLTTADRPLDTSWETQFAGEQIRNLVRQIFLARHSKPPRHVVFSSVGTANDSDTVCRLVGQQLAAAVAGTVAIVEMDWRNATLERFHGRTTADLTSSITPGLLRMFSRQISERLWFVPRDIFLGDNDPAAAISWLPGRLAQIRLDFDYALLQAPRADLCSEALLVASMADGVILIIEANCTRRSVAQRVKEQLDGANARLLGMVLTARTFPIPEGIYNRL